MKNILLIGAGGTILNRAHDKKPSMTIDDVLAECADAREIADIKTREFDRRDSSNNDAYRVQRLCSIIADAWKDYDGFVVLHGTDTMPYSTALSSFLLQQAHKPVIFTGAQRKWGAPGSDARKNLLDALSVAISNEASGILLCFDSNIIRGINVVKIDSKDYGAFTSANYPLLGHVKHGSVEWEHDIRKPKGQLVYYPDVSDEVGHMKIMPSGMVARQLESIAKHAKGLVLEGYGTGGLPCPSGDDQYTENDFQMQFYKTLSAYLIERPAVVVSQCMRGGTDNLTSYAVAEGYLTLGIVPGYAMLPHTALAKMQWACGQSDELREIRSKVSKNILGEMDDPRKRYVDGSKQKAPSEVQQSIVS